MCAKYSARKLIRFHQTGGPHVLRIDEIPQSEPRENEVVVRVKAVGLSRIDVLWREGGYVEDPVFPAQIGYDAAGTVEAVGANPSFPTRGVDDPRSRSRTTSWSKGLPHKSDVLGLAQKLSARADSGRRLGRQGKFKLFEQQLVVGLRVSVAA